MTNLAQWSAVQQVLTRSTPLTVEDLQRFSSANLDPWTLTLGQALCERFRFASLGHRNIGSAFYNLPGEQFNQEQFEIGYGSQHIIHFLLRSTDGVALAAIIGVLAEFFQEDFVVDFFLLLTKKSNVPEGLRPLEHQWRRMVQVLYGVLAISTFGQCSVLTEISAIGASRDFDLENVLSAMEALSEATQTKENNKIILCGPEVSFLAAIATWLFDLRYQVEESQNQAIVPKETGIENDIKIVFKMQHVSTVDPAGLANSVSSLLPGYRHSIDVHGNAGRVPFEKIFQTTFGTNFTRVKDEVLSAYIAGAARMMQDNLDSLSQPSRFGFISHGLATTHGAGFGFIQTMSGWFPELRRLSSRLERISKLSADESRVRFVQAVEQLQADCQCTRCNGQDLSEEGRMCLVIMLELIISLGIHVTRMVVTSKLYPKVKGIWKLYDRLSDASTATKLDKEDPAEGFMQKIGRPLPTSVDMLKMGALLFTNSQSREIDAQSNLMGITHAGMTIFLNGSFRDHDDLSGLGQAALTIRVVPGWMCLFGHEARMEVYQQWIPGWTFDESWNQLSLRTVAVQMLKWQSDVVLSCLMKKSERDEEQAKAQGWLILQ